VEAVSHPLQRFRRTHTRARAHTHTHTVLSHTSWQGQEVTVEVVSHPLQRFAVWFGGSMLAGTVCPLPPPLSISLSIYLSIYLSLSLSLSLRLSLFLWQQLQRGSTRADTVRPLLS
jgi:hypothetical protein